MNKFKFTFPAYEGLTTNNPRTHGTLEGTTSRLVRFCANT